jgi:hypothetical protein
MKGENADEGEKVHHSLWDAGSFIHLSFIGLRIQRLYQDQARASGNLGDE